MDQQEMKRIRIWEEHEKRESDAFYASCFLYVLLPLIALVLLVVGFFFLSAQLGQAGQWVAEETPLAPLFPGQHASTPRILVSAATLLLVGPGGVLLAASAVRGTAFGWLRLLLLPAAVLLVPTVCMPIAAVL